MDPLRTGWHELAAAAFAVPALLVRFLARMLEAWLQHAPALWMPRLSIQLGDDLAPVQGAVVGLGRGSPVFGIGCP